MSDGDGGVIRAPRVRHDGIALGVRLGEFRVAHVPQLVPELVRANQEFALRSRVAAVVQVDVVERRLELTHGGHLRIRSTQKFQKGTFRLGESRDAQRAFLPNGGEASTKTLHVRGFHRDPLLVHRLRQRRGDGHQRVTRGGDRGGGVGGGGVVGVVVVAVALLVAVIPAVALLVPALRIRIITGPPILLLLFVLFGCGASVLDRLDVLGGRGGDGGVRLGDGFVDGGFGVFGFGEGGVGRFPRRHRLFQRLGGGGSRGDDSFRVPLGRHRGDDGVRRLLRRRLRRRALFRRLFRRLFRAHQLRRHSLGRLHRQQRRSRVAALRGGVGALRGGVGALRVAAPRGDERLGLDLRLSEGEKGVGGVDERLVRSTHRLRRRLRVRRRRRRRLRRVARRPRRALRLQNFTNGGVGGAENLRFFRRGVHPLAQTLEVGQPRVARLGARRPRRQSFLNVRLLRRDEIAKALHQPRFVLGRRVVIQVVHRARLRIDAASQRAKRAGLRVRLRREFEEQHGVQPGDVLDVRASRHLATGGRGDARDARANRLPSGGVETRQRAFQRDGLRGGGGETVEHEPGRARMRRLEFRPRRLHRSLRRRNRRVVRRVHSRRVRVVVHILLAFHLERVAVHGLGGGRFRRRERVDRDREETRHNLGGRRRRTLFPRRQRLQTETNLTRDGGRTRRNRRRGRRLGPGPVLLGSTLGRRRLGGFVGILLLDVAGVRGSLRGSVLDGSLLGSPLGVGFFRLDERLRVRVAPRDRLLDGAVHHLRGIEEDESVRLRERLRGGRFPAERRADDGDANVEIDIREKLGRLLGGHGDDGEVEHRGSERAIGRDAVRVRLRVRGIGRRLRPGVVRPGGGFVLGILRVGILLFFLLLLRVGVLLFFLLLLRVGVGVLLFFLLRGIDEIAQAAVVGHERLAQRRERPVALPSDVIVGVGLVQRGDENHILRLFHHLLLRLREREG